MTAHGDIQPIPTSYNVANAQIQETLTHSYQANAEYPLGPWTSVSRAIGPFLPGTLVVVGARPNMGKTSFLAVLFSHLFRHNVKTLYGISGDGGPTRLRKILSALHCGFRRSAVLRNEWARANDILSAEEALKEFWADLKRQQEWSDRGMVYDLPVLSRDRVREALAFGLDNGARVIIVDHVNRWTPNQSRQLTEELADAVRAFAATAVAKGVTIILAAQITPWGKDSRNALSEFVCPPVSALKQSQALVEEPHVILLLHRARRQDVTAEDLRLAAIGQRQPRDLLEPGIMCATVGKNRDEDTVGTTARLHIDATGWIEDADGPTTAVSPPPPREREPGEEPEQNALPF